MTNSYELLKDGDEHEVPPNPKLRSSRTNIVLVMVCVSCTLMNLFFALRINHHQNINVSATTYTDISSLRRPSQFIRFDEIERPSTPVPKQFNNYPILMTQVDKSNPAKIFDDDTRRYMARIGTISPKDKRMLVTGSVSTIVQFRAIDYGMERCELHIVLPTLPNPAASSGSVALSIHRLNATIPLNANSLSFNTLPPYASKVGDVSLSVGAEGAVWRRTFFCSTEEVLTFQVSCSPSTTDENGCHLEWWQNVKKPNPGMYIVQHSSI